MRMKKQQQKARRREKKAAKQMTTTTIDWFKVTDHRSSAITTDGDLWDLRNPNLRLSMALDVFRHTLPFGHGMIFFLFGGWVELRYDRFHPYCWYHLYVRRWCLRTSSCLAGGSVITKFQGMSERMSKEISALAESRQQVDYYYYQGRIFWDRTIYSTVLSTVVKFILL
jgi:hypothetical protein